MIDTFDPSSNRSEYDWRLRVGIVGGSQACPTGVAFQLLWKPENKLEKKSSWVHKSGDLQRLRVQNFSAPSAPRIIKSPWLQLHFID
jgi:hypothetical protein